MTWEQSPRGVRSSRRGNRFPPPRSPAERPPGSAARPAPLTAPFGAPSACSAIAGDLPVAAVRELLAAVRDRGDVAVRELTARFDGADIDDLRVQQGELDAALAAIPPLTREALEAARASILEFHRHQLREDGRHERNGVVVP